MMEYLISFVARERKREIGESGTPSREEELGKPQAIIYLSHLYGRTTDPLAGKSFAGVSERRQGG